MRNSLFRSIRTKLLLLVFISVLPVLGIVLYSGLTILQKDIVRTESDTLRVVRTLAYDHERTVESTRQFLVALARFSDVQNQDSKACNKLFKALLKENPLYANIFSATAEGMVFSNALPFTPHSIRDRKYYRDALRTVDFSVGEYVIGVTLKYPVLHFSYPVRDAGGGFKGIVAVAFDLNRYGHIFSMAGLPPGSRFTLSDHKNRTLYRHPDIENNMGKVDNPDMIRSLSSQPDEGIFMGLGNDGIKCLYGYKKFYLKGGASPYLFLRVGIPEEQALRQARNSLFVNSALLAGALLIAMALAWFLGSRLIVRRLRRLAHAAQRVGHGDLRVRTGLNHSQDELGLLTKAFDEMAGELEDKEAQRKSAEEALRESETSSRTLIENSFDVIFTLNTDGAFLFVSASWERHFGYPVSEVTGKNFASFVHPDDAGPCIEYLTAVFGDVLSGTSPEYRVKHADGSWRWFIANGSTYVDQKGQRQFMGTGRDITDRKRAEEVLRESEERFRVIFERSTVGKSLTTPDGKLLRINKAFADMLGYTIEEILHLNFAQITHQDDVAKGQECIRILLTDRQAIYQMEKRYIHKTGDIVWADISTTLLRDETGTPLYLITSIVDITKRKRAEEENRIFAERLQRAEKMEALGQLAGGVAHDLNNVLGILSGYSELLLEEIPQGSRSRGHVEKILQSTEKGAAIIQDLLTLARRGVTASDVINLNGVVSGFLKSPVFEEMKDYHPLVTFRTEYDGTLLNIKGSTVHLEKTLMNLVSNAAEAISGAGEVTIRTESRYLDQAVRGYDEVKGGDYAVLTVSDTGTGIPAENREKIFEPFYTKKTMGRSGTGLGLAIVWGTVKDHNGYIDVATSVGEGSTFTLYFPATRVELTAQKQKEPIERYMGKGESVLVVDDIADQREIAANLLTRLAYRVHTVSGGEEAVEYLKENKTDILVLDMIMTPGIDGLETYRRVLEIDPRQKAIIVSGFSETDRVREAQKLGAGAYVKKPYVMEKIGAAIRDELGKN